MKNKLLIATILASSFAMAANAAPQAQTAAKQRAQSIEAREEAKLRAAATPASQADEVDYDSAYTEDSAAPAAGNPDVLKYTPTDGQVNYNDKTISNYQDPYASNQRAYKSNEFGEAAPAPRINVFSELQEPTYHDDRYAEERLNARTKQYVRPTSRR